ncbi:MAG: hypothetical protein JXA64_08185, partial [Candidatus Fermentibacteraceae bacterium]|nr:hypothetical protein [Candidatus Fermentibacteraceae bacterium]
MMTGIETVTGWLSIGSLSWSVFRVALVWLAFYGTGHLVKSAGVLRNNFRLMPGVVFGMLSYLAVAVVLSIFHILTRTVLSVLVGAGAAAGFVFLYIQCRRLIGGSCFRLKHPLIILPVLVALYLSITNMMLAGRPEINFNDTQVTYLVQPDRWLNEGRMYFLDETVFSAYPMTSEMLLLLPSSLAADRLDQMVLGQIFSLSMIFALVIAAMSLMRFRWRWYPAAIVSITGCSTILLWCHFAKPDGFALFFVTVSAVILLRQLTEDGSKDDLSAFPVLGLALATKFTVYLTLV